jgi:predicted dienelactone hydrolase
MIAIRRRCWWRGLAAAFAGLLVSVPARGQGYDPLKIEVADKVETLELIVSDEARRREIPLRLYLPDRVSAAPVVLFSHGLGGSREGSAFLGRHWAGRGYVAVFLQHPGSDSSVWQNVPPAKRMAALKEAAGLASFIDRVKDVKAVLDQLKKWSLSEVSLLRGRLDLARVGMSGHSFGAVTTQAVSGQGFPRGRVSFTDARIKAAVIFSPSSPRRGTPGRAFGAVKIPWLLMTGTKDLAAIGNADLASRLAVFPALPPGGKYELVLDKAEHSAFTDRALPGDKEPRNPSHHRAILALSTAFWDAWLGGDPAAKAWLEGADARSALEPGDRWQMK